MTAETGLVLCKALLLFSLAGLRTTYASNYECKKFSRIHAVNVMTEWSQAVPDIILSSLYIYLIVRLATSSDGYFKTPFFKFFIATGFYSILTVVTNIINMQFSFTEKLWTVYILKVSFALNNFGAVAATIGKAYIAIHRYFVIRTQDLSENNWSSSVIIPLLMLQFVVPLFLVTPAWPSTYLYRNGDTNDTIIAFDSHTTKIIKMTSVVTFAIYIVINVIFTALASRAFRRLKKLLGDNSVTVSAIIRQQRNMFIIVAVSSISHLLKGVHQFALAVCSHFHLHDALMSIREWYPVVNGLATYSTPVCLVILSRSVRARLFFFRKWSITPT